MQTKRPLPKSRYAVSDQNQRVWFDDQFGPQSPTFKPVLGRQGPLRPTYDTLGPDAPRPNNTFYARPEKQGPALPENLKPSKANPKIRSAREVRLEKEAASAKKWGRTPKKPPTQTGTGGDLASMPLGMLGMLRKALGQQQSPMREVPKRAAKVTTGRSGMPVLRTKTRRSYNSLIN